jgi:general secretion pathway protein G
MQKNLKQTKMSRKGFTLIEILIVVAIISILASVVLVGLGPTQQSGRDARRLSDIREVQTGLELYFSKCGFYPGSASCGGAGTAIDYTNMATALTGSSIGVSTVPNDPTVGKSYWYGTNAGGTSYVLCTALENANNAAFINYTLPSLTGFSGGDSAIDSVTVSSSTYCITL